MTMQDITIFINITTADIKHCDNLISVTVQKSQMLETKWTFSSKLTRVFRKIHGPLQLPTIAADVYFMRRLLVSSKSTSHIKMQQNNKNVKAP